MELADDLRRIAEAAVVLAEPPEELAGIVPAEPAAGERLYLVAYRREPEGEAGDDAMDLGRARRAWPGGGGSGPGA